MTSTYRIVVGVDGSVGGDRALRWATREADRRGGTVQAVTAWSWDGIEAPPMIATNPIEEKKRTEHALDRAVAAVAAEHPGVTIASEAIEGAPTAVLSGAARDADLLVLGSHGHSRLYQSVVGSVTEQCIRAAVCPVVVVPVPHPERAQKPAEVQPAHR